MLHLGVSQKPIVMPHYPHMLAEDREIWTKYLQDPIEPIDEVWYDVKVGRSVELSADADEVMRKISAGLTRKRIDVVARVGLDHWVIEVKPLGGYVALGQALLYSQLFHREYRSITSVVPVVVCYEADRDVISVFADQGVMCLEVGLPVEI